MSEHAKAKVKKFTEVMEQVTTLTTEMETDAAKNDTPDNHERLTAMLTEADNLRKSIDQDNLILGLKNFRDIPVTPVGGDGDFSEKFGGGQSKSIGEMFVESEVYKQSVKSGSAHFAPGFSASFDAKGFLPDALRSKATFGTGSTGLDSSRTYVPGVIMIEQQRLTVRDLLAVGETSQNIVYFIKESSFVNAAGMVAEGLEKPEATLNTTTASAPVCKIAVVLKVTEEMWNDFPMLRDYINGRLTFMVQAREEDQLLNGSGAANNLTGLMNTSGIQTQANAANDVEAIHKAKTKIRTAAASVGGYEPDGIIVHPTDWQTMRLQKDANNQYYGGGPFSGTYGVGAYPLEPLLWGLRPVVTVAIPQGTALVGAFKLGAQIWQREGIRVESTNTNEDDFNNNLMSLRVEERLALTVYRPSAFCTVTGL